MLFAVFAVLHIAVALPQVYTAEAVNKRSRSLTTFGRQKRLMWFLLMRALLLADRCGAAAALHGRDGQRVG
jgi:hypothetical protein